MPVRFSAAVEKTIAEVCPPRDAFDAADFDPVEYLNSRFPDEGSLAALPAFLEETNNRLRSTEAELLRAVETQATQASSTDIELKSVTDAVSGLYQCVSEIKSKAADSEATVKELCQHIYELDTAKTNLTASINTLRSIQLWTLQLQVLSTSFERRRYTQCRDALQEAQKYSTMFDRMKMLPKIKELNTKQAQLCKQIEFHIRTDIFGDLSLDSMDESVMAEACSIIDVMGEESYKKIRECFIDKALETYSMRFKRGTEDAKLERTERRYVYIRNLLQQYESLFLNVFRRDWCVPQELCVTFCLRTKQELDYQLQEAASSIDVVVLIYVLQKTIDIERDLTHMMAWKEDFPRRRELPSYKYNGLILSAFKQHMGLFVRNEDRLMGEALSQPFYGQGDSMCPGWNSVEEETRVGVTLPIAEDLFVFIKESLKRTLRISQQDVLLEMAGVWRTHLIRFSEIIADFLPDAASSPLAIRRVCIIVNTADLCQSTSQDLAEEVCTRSEAPAKVVAFDTVVDAFSRLYSRSIQSVVQGLEVSLNPHLVEYGNGGFMTHRDDEAGDASPIIRSIATILHDTVQQCGFVLPSVTQRFFLDKAAASIIPRYTNTLYRLRRLPEEAVGIMRVDAAALEKIFLHLPNYHESDRFSAPMLSGYTKLVRREFDQLNRTLKVLQVNATSTTFADIYYDVMLPEDRSIQNFVRLVELKGLSREQVRQWITNLSRRGVVEATQRDFVREAALAIDAGTAPSPAAGGGALTFATLFSRDGTGVTSTSNTGRTTHATASPTTVGFFSNLVSSIGSSPNGGQRIDYATVPATRCTTASALNTTPGAFGSSSTTDAEESIGSRFASVARSTATSINFLGKFKKNQN